jgi:hypothetical protein
MNELIKKSILLFILFFVVAGCKSNVSRQQDLKIVQRGIDANISSLTECYVKNAETDNAAGQIIFSVVVAKNGNVKNVQIVTNQLGKTVGSCFKKALKKIVFPSLGSDVKWQDSVCFDPDPTGTVCKKVAKNTKQ